MNGKPESQPLGLRVCDSSAAFTPSAHTAHLGDLSLPPTAMPEITPGTAPAADPPPPDTQKTHPDFVKPEDIVLRSADNVRFNIARRDLERTSGWFRSMFEASNRTSASDTSEEIPVFEDAATLAIVLKAALGLKAGSNSPTTIEAYDTAYRTAVKYEMEGVMEQMHLRLWRALLQAKDPVQQYIYACQHHFDQLREDAFDRCSRIDISYSRFNTLDTSDFSRLVTTRMQRIEDIHTILCNTTLGSLGHAAHLGQCSCCRSSLTPSGRMAWVTFVRVCMQRSVHVPDVEGLLREAGVNQTYEALRGTACPNNKFPFYDIKEQLLVAVKQRETQRKTALGHVFR